jgi:DNA-binding cell septation regulator SpoVG
MITVTAVTVYPFEAGSRGGVSVRAYAEVEIDGSLVLKGLKVLQTAAGGYFIGYPSQRARRDTFVDVVVPGKEAARLIREAVMTEFKKVMGIEAAEDGPPAPAGTAP